MKKPSTAKTKTRSPEKIKARQRQIVDLVTQMLLRRDQDRNGENGENGADDLIDPPPILLARIALRLRDLHEARIADSYNQINNLIRNEGFPVGCRLGANTRVWWLPDVIEWLDKRKPAAVPKEPPSHAARHTGRPRGRPRKALPQNDSAAPEGTA
jgi:hypothetical protein